MVVPHASKPNVVGLMVNPSRSKKKETQNKVSVSFITFFCPVIYTIKVNEGMKLPRTFVEQLWLAVWKMRHVHYVSACSSHSRSASCNKPLTPSSVEYHRLLTWVWCGFQMGGKGILDCVSCQGKKNYPSQMPLAERPDDLS